MLREQDEALERAVREDHLLGRHLEPLGDQLAQRRVAGAGAVGEDRLAVALEDGARAVGELLLGQALGRGHAAREGDDRLHVPNLAGPAQPPSPVTIPATSVGVVPTAIPTASSASFFACAVPELPEMIAPAWPIVFPGGAEKPAM